MGAIDKCSRQWEINGGVSCQVNQKKRVVTNGSLVGVGQLTTAMAVLSTAWGLLGSTQGF